MYIKELQIPSGDPEEPTAVWIYPDGKVKAFCNHSIVDACATPVPPHGRLIDIDQTLDVLAHRLGIRSLDYLTAQEKVIVDWFMAAPTILPGEASANKGGQI